MEYYERITTRREPINRFGKLGFVAYVEYFKTNSEEFVTRVNKGKRIKFMSVERDKKFLHIDSDVIYIERCFML